MSAGISLIVGLGNPGPEYAETRHNAGFRFLERLAQRDRCTLRAEPRFSGEVAKARLGGREVWLLAPQTFMNLSGDAVLKLARYYKIPSSEILVVHDELDLPPGVVRLKQGGGAGGHNGLSDIIAKLGAGDFLRLRIGIGRPASGAQVVSFVLNRAPKAEQALIDEAIDAALRHIEEIVEGKMQQVMGKLHTPPKKDSNQQPN
jgi:PTH1 family peptidyl-tRNA hydrolase